MIGDSATYGKGKIQSVYELADGSALFVTIARYKTPVRMQSRAVTACCQAGKAVADVSSACITAEGATTELLQHCSRDHHVHQIIAAASSPLTACRPAGVT